MRVTCFVIATILLLCTAGCGGPGSAEVERLLIEKAAAGDAVFETLDLPVAVVPQAGKGFLNALQAAGYVTLGDCSPLSAAAGQKWVRCPVELTEKGERDLAPYEVDARMTIPMSEPRYAITRTLREDDKILFEYSHTAVPSPIRETLTAHGFSGPQVCGTGFVVYTRQDDEWEFSNLQGQRKHPCN